MTDSAVEDVEEKSEIARTRGENGTRPSRSAHQKRFDTLTRRNRSLKAENCELRRANEVLQDGLARSLRLVDKLRGKNVR